MAVVKANGYGHGIVTAAGALTGADSLAVARTDEARQLREAGISKPIVLLEGPAGVDDLRFAAEHALELVIHSPEQLAMLESYAGAGAFTVWLKMDTGMGRLGLAPGQYRGAWARLDAAAAVRKPIGLMTHLANADDREDSKTRNQLRVFEQYTQGIEGPRSIANSGGILGWPKGADDTVRPGIMLYGVSPFPESVGADLGLRPAMTVESDLISVKTVAKGESVGYGGRWIAPADTRIGIVAAGYGDGYPRHAADGTPVLVNGVVVHLAGCISMDMLAVDLSPVPEASVGDSAVLWGRGLPVESVAASSGTIGYELLCQITRRVEMMTV